MNDVEFLDSQGQWYEVGGAAVVEDGSGVAQVIVSGLSPMFVTSVRLFVGMTLRIDGRLVRATGARRDGEVVILRVQGDFDLRVAASQSVARVQQARAAALRVDAAVAVAAARAAQARWRDTLDRSTAGLQRIVAGSMQSLSSARDEGADQTDIAPP